MASNIISGGPWSWNGDSRKLVEIILDDFTKFGSKTFMVEDATGRSVTYQDALYAIKGFAASLQRKGFGKGSIVCVISETTLEVIYVMFGTWLAGCTLCGVNWALKPHEILHELVQAQPDIIYTSDDLVLKTKDVVKDIAKIPEIITKGGAQKCFQDFQGYNMPNIDENDPLLLIFTSGSTGMPKGVLWHEKGLRAFATGRKMVNLPEQQNYILMTEIFWMTYSMTFLTSITTGITVIIPKSITDYDGLFRLIEKYKPLRWFSSHTVLMNMLASPNRFKYDLSSLKEVILGGSTVSGNAKRKIKKELFSNRIAIHNIYGITEVGVNTEPCGNIDDTSPEFECVGKLKKGMEAKIIDLNTGSTLGPNETGEIMLKSKDIRPSLLEGDMTKSLDADGFFRTGDIGFYDSKGCLYVTARVKEVLKYRHNQVFPPELESVLNEHPEVVNSCVVGKFDEVNGDLPTAFVVRKAGSKVTAEELISHVADRVSEYKRLHGGVYFVDALPTSRNGKVLRREAKKLLDSYA